jgi:hypothetical protein
MIEFKNLLEKKLNLHNEQFKKVVDMVRCAADIPVIYYFHKFR